MAFVGRHKVINLHMTKETFCIIRARSANFTFITWQKKSSFYRNGFLEISPNLKFLMKTFFENSQIKHFFEEDNKIPPFRKYYMKTV